MQQHPHSTPRLNDDGDSSKPPPTFHPTLALARCNAYLKAVAPPVASALALGPFVLVPAISGWVGQYAFLSYVFLVLFFFPAPATVGRFFETALLSLFAAAVAIAISVLALCGAIWIDAERQPYYSSVQSRTVGACSLVLLALLAGTLGSAVPRFKTPSRCALFASVWAITSGYVRIDSALFTDMFYPILLAAIIGFLANILVFPLTARSTFLHLVTHILDVACDVLERVIDDFFQTSSSSSPDDELKPIQRLDQPGPASVELQRLRDKLVGLDVRFEPTFQAAENEWSISRVPIGKFKAYIHLLRSMRSWIACGMGLKSIQKEGDADKSKGQSAAQDDGREGAPSSRSRCATYTVHEGTVTRLRSVDSVARRVEVCQFQPAVRNLCCEVVTSLRMVKLSIEMSTGRVNPAKVALSASSSRHRHTDHNVHAAVMATAMAGIGQKAEATLTPDEVLSKQRQRLRRAISAFKESLREALQSVRPMKSTTRTSDSSQRTGAEDDPSEDAIRSRRDGSAEAEFGVRRSDADRAADGTVLPHDPGSGTTNRESSESEPSGGTTDDEGQDRDDADKGEQGRPTKGPSAEQDFASLFRGELYAVSFLMVSLLEIALLSEACLRAGQSILRSWQRHPRRRIWLPNVTWKTWLKHSGDTHSNETYSESTDLLDDDDDDNLDVNGLDGGVAAGAIYFDRDSDSEICQNFAPRDGKDEGKTLSLRRPLYTTRLLIHRLSRSMTMLKLRIRLSRAIRRVRHSRHVKFGIKLALGVSLLSLPAWLDRGPARDWWYERRGQWMVISYLYVLESSTGASFRVSLFRIIGTVAGSLLGLTISKISQDNRWALGLLLSAAYVPAAHFMLFTRAEGIGIVMGLTAPIIALIPTLAPDPSETAVELAWNRGYMIFLGIVAALLVNIVIWPLHARVELVRQISRCTVLLQQLYLGLSRQMLTGGFVASAETSVAFEKLENVVERKITKARDLVQMMEAEISLIPKRTDILSEILSKLLKIAELLRGLRRCREHGLRSIRQEAVVNVLELRQNTVASVLIVLWSTGQALLTHAPLPQFLPSPRLALAELTTAVAQQLGSSSSERASVPHTPIGGGAGGERVPDAYHALTNLTSHLSHERQRGRKRTTLHTLQTSSPKPIQHGSTTPTQAHTPTTPYDRATDRRSTMDYASFFILAEHALLSDIVDALESLMRLTRTLVGEASFLQTHFVPRGNDGEGAETYAESQHQTEAPAARASLARALKVQIQLDSSSAAMVSSDARLREVEDDGYRCTAGRQVRIESDPTSYRVRNTRTTLSPLRNEPTSQDDVVVDEEGTRHHAALDLRTFRHPD